MFSASAGFNRIADSPCQRFPVFLIYNFTVFMKVVCCSTARLSRFDVQSWRTAAYVAVENKWFISVDAELVATTNLCVAYA